ncbi:major facilitator superfamily domain-containing protein [Xylogone sp. PMI_703]|nr:major facilitator superfamily domain-containing protein [Xylogone sp. PMI_703]
MVHGLGAESAIPPPKYKEQNPIDLEANSTPKPVGTTNDGQNEGDSCRGTNERAKVEGSTHDPNLVWWNEPADEDPGNPMAWPSWKKWTTIGIISFITFLTPLASAMLAPAVPDIMAEFHVSSSVYATFVVSIFVLGFSVGPLVIAPLSESYGRVPIYNTCNVLFIVFTVLCAIAKDASMLLAARFLAGVAGVATVTCGSGTIADMLPTAERGRAMALWSMGPLLGPVIGPIAGGYLVEARGWRWVFWVIVILAGSITVAAALFLQETYAPVILERKASRLRKATGNPLFHSKLATDKPSRQLIKESIIRPAKMLITFPIVTSMCLYIAFLYGALYILFTTFTFVFEDQYGFSVSNAGLSFLGSGIGSFIGLAYGGIFSDRSIKKRQALGETPTPEDRLPLLLTIPASLSLPLGLFLYGWSAQYRVHWIVPEIGTVIISFGMMTILMCIQTYLVDAYTVHAASVTAANASLRSALGGLLPLCGLKLYNAIGLGWGNSLLAFIALAMAPLPIAFRIFGARLRNFSQPRE